MALYTLHPLTIPTGFTWASAVKINSNGEIAGTCAVYSGLTSAMVWHGGGYTVIGPPGNEARSSGINSNQIVIGSYEDDKVKTHSFYWDIGSSVFTLLNPPVQDSFGYGAYVTDINDSNQIVGYSHEYGGGTQNSLFWNGLNSNPVPFGNQNVMSWPTGINNNGIIIGSILNGADFQGYYGDVSTQSQTLIPNCRGCYAINDLPKPQILIYYNLNTSLMYMYDTATNSMVDLNVPGDVSGALDINNNSEIVGESNNNGAVIWKGLIRINLNDPLISDAQIKGWTLSTALGINDNGQIIGTGFFGGSQLPFKLNPNPNIKAHRLQLDYMLPHIIWPGEAYDRPRPRGWPIGFPYPLPEPGPFQLVGEAYKMQQDFFQILKLKEIVNNLSDQKVGASLDKIVTKLIEQKKEKLYNLVMKSLQGRNKQGK